MNVDVCMTCDFGIMNKYRVSNNKSLTAEFSYWINIGPLLYPLLDYLTENRCFWQVPTVVVPCLFWQTTIPAHAQAPNVCAWLYFRHNIFRGIFFNLTPLWFFPALFSFSRLFYATVSHLTYLLSTSKVQFTLRRYVIMYSIYADDINEIL